MGEIREPRQHNPLCVLAAVAVAVALTKPSFAAETPPSRGQADAPNSSAEPEVDVLEEIVVTGTTMGLSRLEAGFSITVLNAADIERVDPKSTADLFKVVPGLWSETAGGETGANVFVRGFPTTGDAEFVTLAVDGVPIFAPPTLAFLENSTLFRIDETVERFEALRGGPNTVLTNGQSGVTLNFIQKTGGSELDGLIKATATDYGSSRLDGFFSGPLGSDHFFAIGGFYRVSDGVRETQYDADKGGQFSANFSGIVGGAEYLAYARYLSDKNVAYQAVFMNSSASGDVSDFPGFDPLTDTYNGAETRRATLEVGPNGEAIRRDLADGRGADVLTGGLQVVFDDVGGFRIQNRLNFLTGEANTVALVPAVTPQAASAWLNGFDAGGSGGTFSFSATDQPFTNLSSQLFSAGFWAVDKDVDSIVNDLTVTRLFSDDNRLSVGVYAAKWKSKDYWDLGNLFLLTAEPNARRVDLVLNDGTQITRDGFFSGPFFQFAASWEGDTVAAYSLYEKDIGDRLRLDLGARFERYSASGRIENTTFGVDLDGNPATAYNNGAAVLNGTFRSVEFDEDAWSWTAGINYEITDSTAAFVRVNNGQKFPHFDDLRNGITNLQEIDQYEVGFKAVSKRYSLFATLFYNEFDGLPFTRFVNTIPTTVIGTSSAKGIELEASVLPWGEALQLSLSGTYQDGDFDEFGDNSGNRIARQPKVQVRFTPSYRVALGTTTLEVFSTVSHVGERFSDPENLQRLPEYTKIDAGARLELNDRFSVQLTGDNLTDELALTEGNVFIVGAQQGVIFARPLPGRTFELSVGYEF